MGNVQFDSYCLEQGPSTKGIEEKESALKPDYWEEVTY